MNASMTGRTEGLYIELFLQQSFTLGNTLKRILQQGYFTIWFYYANLLQMKKRINSDQKLMQASLAEQENYMYNYYTQEIILLLKQSTNDFTIRLNTDEEEKS